MTLPHSIFFISTYFLSSHFHHHLHWRFAFGKDLLGVLWRCKVSPPSQHLAWTDTPTSLDPIASSHAVSIPGVPGSRSGGKTPIGGHSTGSASAMNHEQVVGLQAQLKEMSAHLEGPEKEPDFYFAKVTFSPYLLYQSVC